MNKKILYIFDASDWDSRMAVAILARKAGAKVVVGLINGDKASPDFNTNFDSLIEEKLVASKCEPHDSAKPEWRLNEDSYSKNRNRYKIVPLKSSTKNIGILSSLQMVKKIWKLISQEKPDIIHVVTLKYGFMTGIAALPFKATHKIYTLAGLGYLFRGCNLKSKILRAALRPFLTFILRRKNTTLIFQNSDDLDLMVKGRYVRREDSVLIKGSGVYLDRFKQVPSDNNSNSEQTPIILMPTRLVHEKGIAVFIEAAKILEKCGVKARFQIAGGETKHNPRAISRHEMQNMLKGSNVQWLGRVDNMPELLSQVTLVVYPSYYGEGIPRVLLESCAAGRAIVTTDHAGCREAVVDGVNGLLVAIKNPQETADAIADLLNNHARRANMEVQSRKLAESEFDINIIANKTLKIYRL